MSYCRSPNPGQPHTGRMGNTGLDIGFCLQRPQGDESVSQSCPHDREDPRSTTGAGNLARKEQPPSALCSVWEPRKLQGVPGQVLEEDRDQPEGSHMVPAP